MQSESSYTPSINEAKKAIRQLDRAAKAEGLTRKEIAEHIRLTRQTISRRFQEGDMMLSEFITIANLARAKPTNLLADALADCKEESDG